MKLREAKSIIFSSAEHCRSPAPDVCVHWVAQSWQNPGSCKYHLHPVKLSCAAVCPHGPCLFFVFRISDILLTDFDNIVSHVRFEIYTSDKNEGFQCFHFKTGHEWPAVPWARSTHQTSSQSKKGVPWSSIIYHKMAFCLTFRMFGSFFFNSNEIWSRSSFANGVPRRLGETNALVLRRDDMVIAVLSSSSTPTITNLSR